MALRRSFGLTKLCADPAALKRRCLLRNVNNVDVDALCSAYAELKQQKQRLNEDRALLNTLSRSSMTSEDARKDATEIKARIKQAAVEETALEARVEAMADRIPNDIHPNTPIGPAKNAAICSIQGIKPEFSFLPLDHNELGKRNGWIDTEFASRVSGHAHYYLTGRGALLELALVNYAVSMAVANGYIPVKTPDMVREDVLSACGFRPRAQDAGQIYTVSTDSEESSELCLSATAEIPLAGLFANQTLSTQADEALPWLRADKNGIRRVVGIGQAFRAEAGARGRATRGIYRVHQFTKVELFAVAPPSKSDVVLEEIRQLQEQILSGLDLYFRVLDMPTEELGAAAYRKYDVEAWMPGRDDWGELSSASNCTDYQARRLGIRWRSSLHEKPGYAHTLNGTAMAVPRVIIALLEQRQQANGNIDLPHALQPFLNVFNTFSNTNPVL